MSRRLAGAIALVAFTANACALGGGEHASSRSKSARASASVAVTAAWSTALDSPPTAVAADGDGVVTTVDHRGVVSLDARGRVRWVAELDGASVGAPVAFGDRVVVPTSRADGSGGCAGLDRETGETRWTYEAIGTGGVAVARAGDLVICVLRDGRTAGIPPSLGLAVWEYTFASDVDPSTIEVPARTTIAVDEKAGYFAFTVRYGRQWAVAVHDIETGKTRRVLVLDGVPTSPAVVRTGVLAAAVSTTDALVVVDVRAERWTQTPIPAAAGFDPATVPLVAGAVVVVAARGGAVTAVDISSRRPLWTASTPDPIADAHPLLVGSAVLLATGTGQVAAFGLEHGDPVRLPRAPGRVIATVDDPTSGAVSVVARENTGGRIESWEAQPES